MVKEWIYLHKLHLCFLSSSAYPQEALLDQGMCIKQKFEIITIHRFFGFSKWMLGALFGQGMGIITEVKHPNCSTLLLLLQVILRGAVDKGYELLQAGWEPGGQGCRHPDPLRRLVGLQQGADHPGHGAHGGVQHVTVFNLDTSVYI